MFRLIFFILSVSLYSTSYASDTVELGSAASWYINAIGNVSSSPLMFSVDNKNISKSAIKDITLFSSHKLGNVSFLISKKERSSIVKYLDKYIKWNEQAKEMKVKLEKDIGQLRLSSASFSYGSNWYKSHKKPKLNFSFESYTKRKHRLYITIERMTPKKNKFVRADFERIYLDEDDVQRLKSIINEKSLTTFANKKLADKRSISSKFK